MENVKDHGYRFICSEIQWMPSVAFIALWQSLGTPYLLEAEENYQKRSFRNRAYIMLPQGRTLLSIPLNKGKNQQMNIQEVTVNYDSNWQDEHLKTIRTAYGSASFFEHYFQDIEAMYHQRFERLWDWNMTWLNWFRDKLYLSYDMVQTKNYEHDKSSDILDLRNIPKNKLKLSSLKKNPGFWYPQIFEEELGFDPNLSIIDLLMNTGPEAGTYLSQYWIDES